MASPNQPQPLSPSSIGTKSHWDDIYASELVNHTANAADEGTVWFEESGAEERVIAYLARLPLPPATDDGEGSRVDNAERRDVRILDVGTGNGHMLFALRDEGWRCEMVGLDYSQASVRLARQIQDARRREAQSEHDEHGQDHDDDIRFLQCDILESDVDGALVDAFNIVLDKGTFDAVSLSNEAVDERGRRGCEVYAERIARLMKPDAFLVVVSCNWTEDELVSWFTGYGAREAGLKVHGKAHFPSFEFGGQKGQTVSCVCFQKADAG